MNRCGVKILSRLVASTAMLILIHGCSTAPQRAVEEAGDYVILLHGLNRTRMSMKRLEKTLTRSGYDVINITYPSSRFSVEELAEKHLAGIIRDRIHDRKRRVHFVTHSLGGIILRRYLKDHAMENLGRVVMLSPPNNGSEITDRFKDNFFYKALTGPAGQQLGTDRRDTPRALGPVDFEVGIITGDLSLNPYFSRLINESNDGTVSVESARIEGMSDFLVVRSSHTFIMQNKNVINQVVHFIKNGEFQGEQRGA